MFFAQTPAVPGRQVRRRRPPPPGSERLELPRRPGKGSSGCTFRRPAPDGGEARPRLRRQCLERGRLAEYLHDLYPDADVLAFHYRGYRPSGGGRRRGDAQDALYRLRLAAALAAGGSSPSASASAAAWPPLWRRGGRSTAHPGHAVRSLADLAAGHYPLASGPAALPHDLPPPSAWPTAVPVAIFAPARHARQPARPSALRRAMPNPVFDRTDRRRDHNDIYESPGVPRAMREALRQGLRPGG